MKKTVAQTLKDHAELITLVTPQDIEECGDHIIVIRLYEKKCENFDEVRQDLGL